jgi:hypothetical protein
VASGEADLGYAWRKVQGIAAGAPAGRDPAPGDWLAHARDWWDQLDDSPTGSGVTVPIRVATAGVDPSAAPDRASFLAVDAPAEGDPRPPAALALPPPGPEHSPRLFFTEASPPGAGNSGPEGLGPESEGRRSADRWSSYPETWSEHDHAFSPAASALGYAGAALAGTRADPQPGVSPGLGMLGADLALSMLYALPQLDQLLVTLVTLPVPADSGPGGDSADGGQPTVAPDPQAAWVGELVAPTQAWGAAAALLALPPKMLGTAEALRREAAAVLSWLLHSPWVPVLTGALAAGEVCRRRARKARRPQEPTAEPPGVSAPSGLT